MREFCGFPYMNDWLTAWYWAMAGCEFHLINGKALHTPLNWSGGSQMCAPGVTFLPNHFLPVAHGNSRSLAHLVRRGIELTTSGFLVIFDSALPRRELPHLVFEWIQILCYISAAFMDVLGSGVN